MSRLAFVYGPDQPELPVDAQGLDVVLRRSTDRHHISGGFLWHAGDATGRGRLIWSGIPGLFSSDCLDVLTRELAGVGIASVRVDLTPIMKTDSGDEAEEVDDEESDAPAELVSREPRGEDSRPSTPDLAEIQRAIEGREFHEKIDGLIARVRTAAQKGGRHG